MKLSERFWSKVAKSGDCWLWTASKDKKGYGSFRDGNRTVYAHRWAWTSLVGEIPSGMKIDHRCHTHNCVKPTHLRVVTNKQNLEHRKTKPGQVRGLFLMANGKWSTKVCHNYKVYRLGTFTNKEEAERVVIAKRNELFTHNDLDRSTQ